MKRAAVALAMMLAACSADHPSLDLDGAVADAGGDARVEPPADAGVDARLADAFAPDAWAPDAFCPDGDGDGARDAACGGDDCDDTDPLIGPAHSVCAGPVSVRHCVGAARVDEMCPSATPDCDARTGDCAVSACGDLVVQPDEQCDGSSGGVHHACGADCRTLCWQRDDCIDPAFPYCIARDTIGGGQCVAGNPGGAALGELCSTSSDCESTWCDSVQSRCSIVTEVGAECVSALPTWDSLHASPLYGPATPGGPYVCEFGCERQSDCPSGSGCTPLGLNTPDGNLYVTGCRPSYGTLAFGDPTDGTMCSSNTFTTGPTSAVCSAVCVDDSDCAPPLPHCIEMTHLASLPYRPVPPWLTPWPRICSP